MIFCYNYAILYIVINEVKMFGNNKGGGYTSIKNNNSALQSNVNPMFSKYKKKSAAQVFLDKKMGIDESKLTPEEKYQRILDAKINDMRLKAMQGGAGRFSMMSGAEGGEEKQLSKGMEAFVRQQAEKLAKAEHKKLMEKTVMQVKARNLPGGQGGWIDKKGNIFGPDRTVVAKINLKTGKVTALNGTYICKYKSGGNYGAESKIADFVAKKYHKPAPPPQPLWD
jgi:hypothetical protein